MKRKRPSLRLREAEAWADREPADGEICLVWRDQAPHQEQVTVARYRWAFWESPAGSRVDPLGTYWVPAAPSKRVQRRRTKGWRMPLWTKSVTRPGKWGNPYTHAEGPLLERYRAHVMHAIDEGSLDPTELLGYEALACWCPHGALCHAGVLIHVLADFAKSEFRAGRLTMHAFAD